MSAAELHDFNRRALNPQRSVVIEACAGSGKTWLLVSRMVRLLLAGVPPGQILAITFTRKAAQEMAARLREWLLELAVADDDQARRFLRDRAVPEAELDALLPQARRLYEQSLTAQPPLTIATFHSWFLQLMKRAPFDAGLAGANLVENTAVLIEDAWQRFAAELQRAPASPAARGLEDLFARYGLHSTRRLLLAFLRRRAEWWAYTRHTRDGQAAIEYALQRLRANIDLDRDVCADLFADGTFVAELRSFAALLERNTGPDKSLAARLVAALDIGELPGCFQRIWPAVLTAEGDARKRSANSRQAQRLGAAAEQRLLQLHSRLTERALAARRDLADQDAYHINAAGLAAGVELLDAYRRIKEGRQVIDFADVECRAFELLSSSDHAAFLHYKLDARYRHVLLDEFQDTNPLQWLTLDAWFTAAQEADARPTVFMVGDPKQSIYRFRRAEARLFGQARIYLSERFDADGGLKRDVSRRCAQPVIDLVNAVFALEEGFGPHAAHYDSKPGRVEVLPLIEKDDSTPAAGPAAEGELRLRDSLTTPFADVEDRRRAEEAEQLAARINAIEGRWVIESDPGIGGTRKADFKDIMILVRQRTHLATYERALRAAGIPFVTSGRGGLLDTLEAKDVMALLQFLVSPFANLPLAQTLRAPLFACSDDDLIEIARAEGKTWWSRLQDLATNQPQRISPALGRAARLLAAWLARADALPVHDQLDRIYFESDLIQRYRAAVPRAMRDAVTANLRAIMQRALDTDAGRYPSLPRFIHELADLGDAPPGETPDEGIIGDPGNAVRILTVHGAKGLEAPIVCLIDTAAERRPESSYDVMVAWEPGTVAPQHMSLWTRKAERSRKQETLAGEEDVLDRREDTNLLYVAITRAKQALIVSGVQGDRADASWYARIRAAAASHADAIDAAGAAIILGDDLTAMAPPLAATTVQASPPAPPAPGLLNAPLPTGMRRAGVTGVGLRYGSNFHRLLELLTTSTAPRDGIRAAIQSELGLTERELSPLWEQAQRVIASPALARFFDPAQYVRAANEVAYAASSGNIFRIDRLVEFEDEVWILDYKTGAAREIDDGRIEEYQAQVGGYLGAVKQAFPHRHVRAAIVFADASTLEIGS